MADTNGVAELKERIYNRAMQLTRDTGQQYEAERYLRELGMAPVQQFEVGADETVESVNAAVFAKLAELGLTRYADELGLERPGTQEVTVRVTFRLSPQELANLTGDGHLPNKQPVRISMDSDTEPTEV